MIQAHNKLREGTSVGLQKARNEKPTANIILDGERQKTVLLRSGIRQEYLLRPLLFNIVLEVPDRKIRQEKEIKDIYVGREEVKLFLFTDDMILCIVVSEESLKSY